MTHDQVTQYLRDYRSYRYAAQNGSKCFGGSSAGLSVLYSERIRDKNLWDATRYNRIVHMIDGAVNEVLSDDEQIVIRRKYLDRNTMTLNEIADILHKDRSTVSRWHTEALRQLSIALEPLSAEESEINNIDHMFDPNWTYKTPA